MHALNIVPATGGVLPDEHLIEIVAQKCCEGLAHGLRSVDRRWGF
jgi:hypothetical protein